MLWIVDGGLGFTLPVEGRVEDWQKGESITITHGSDGEWTDTVRYEARGECHRKWRNGYGFCSECGANVTSSCNVYCWQCGRKIGEAIA